MKAYCNFILFGGVLNKLYFKQVLLSDPKMERTGPQEKSHHAKNANKHKLDPSGCNNDESITVMKPSVLQLGSSSEGESISK